MTLTALELAVGCPDGKGGMEWVGMAATRDRVHNDTALHKFSGSVPSLQVEYVIPDYTKKEKVAGGFVGTREGANSFKPRPGSRYYPGMELKPAAIGGPLVESYFAIQLFNNHWWIGYNGDWLGYYENSLFTVMNPEKNPGRKGMACVAEWYGEVYAQKHTLWPWADMGSGEFADQGLGKAAYFRDPFYREPGGKPHWLDKPAYVSPFNTFCYTTSQLYSGVSPWDRLFFVGGPGGRHPGCE